jgi:hypothetical protein
MFKLSMRKSSITCLLLKNTNLSFFLDDSYASAAHSAILLYIQVSWKCMAKKLRVAGDDEYKLNTKKNLVKVLLFLRYKTLKICSKFPELK